MTPAIETAADSTDRVAIIVSNYNMPEMDGIALALKVAKGAEKGVR